MKRFTTICTVLIVFSITLFAESNLDLCPWFGGEPSWGNAVGYNLNATPYSFELAIYGDTTGAKVQWYTYNYGQDINDTVPYHGEGSNTVSNCHPATDQISSKHYVCVVKTPACPQGVIYNNAYANVYGNCETFSEQTFTLTSSKTTYTEGDKIVIKATYSGYGGFHYFTWTKDGVAIDSTAEHQIYEDPDNFHESVLTIPVSALSDAGKYSVKVVDGESSSGSPCSMTSNSLTIKVKPACQEIVYRKWNNVLFVDNSQDLYTSYQWYKDNQVIAGATDQYYHTNGISLQGDGHIYAVVATTTDGKQIRSCNRSFGEFPISANSQPQTIGRAALYTNMGVKVGEWSEQPASVSVTPGIYVWQFTDTEGHAWMTKVVY